MNHTLINSNIKKAKLFDTQISLIDINVENNHIAVCSENNLKVLNTITDDLKLYIRVQDIITALHLSHHDSNVLIAFSNVVYMIDITSKKYIYKIVKPECCKILSLNLSKDNKYILASGIEMFVTLWSIKKPKPIRLFGAMSDIIEYDCLIDTIPFEMACYAKNYVDKTFAQFTCDDKYNIAFCATFQNVTEIRLAIVSIDGLLLNQKFTTMFEIDYSNIFHISSKKQLFFSIKNIPYLQVMNIENLDVAEIQHSNKNNLICFSKNGEYVFHIEEYTNDITVYELQY